jgi:hypothetical protein
MPAQERRWRPEGLQTMNRGQCLLASLAVLVGTFVLAVLSGCWHKSQNTPPTGTKIVLLDEDGKDVHGCILLVANQESDPIQRGHIAGPLSPKYRTATCKILRINSGHYIDQPRIDDSEKSNAEGAVVRFSQIDYTLICDGFQPASFTHKFVWGFASSGHEMKITLTKQRPGSPESDIGVNVYSESIISDLDKVNSDDPLRSEVLRILGKSLERVLAKRPSDLKAKELLDKLSERNDARRTH